MLRECADCGPFKVLSYPGNTTSKQDINYIMIDTDAIEIWLIQHKAPL